MCQKMTSWVRNNFGNIPLIFGKNNIHKMLPDLKRYFSDHPRLGGGIIIFVILFGTCSFLFLWNLAPAAPGSKVKQIFEVPMGMPLRQVGKLLEARGLIRNEPFFELFVRLNPKKHMVKAGRYQLGAGMSVPRIIKELGRGIPEDIRITVPEGLTSLEIADLFAKKGIADKQRFIEELKNIESIRKILGDPSIKSAEGYLFPDTYDFSINVTEAEIINKLVSRYKQVFIENIGMVDSASARKILIMASIIEGEAKKEAERPVIAGIFYNRLRLRYPLQSCATIQYALGKRKQKLYYKDLEINSPYNTYRHNGLPPGPISNPGVASLKAAAFPAKVDYLYFVARPDGSHIFSRTYQQHLIAQRNLK